MSPDYPRSPTSSAPTPEAAGLAVPAHLAVSDRHERDLEFLARSAMEWVEMPPDGDILVFAGRRVFELVGDAVVLVSEYSARTKTMRCRAEFAPPEVRARWQAAGPALTGGEVRLVDEAFAGLTLARLVVVPGGIEVVTCGYVAPESARALEAAIGFRQALAMGFTLGCELFGSLIILTCEHTDLPDPRIIEAFVNQATVALQRRRAEESLREGERRFRELADGLPQTVVEFDRDGRVTFANRFVLGATGFGPDHVAAGMSFVDGVAPEDRERAWAGFRRALEGETVLGAEFTGIRPDGTRYEFASYTGPIVRDGQVVGVRGIGIDITDRKRADAARQQVEAQLRHAEKLESLAVLAGGLAHDYNNLLVAILGNAELALTGLKSGTVAYERVSKIQRAARRAAELTNQLLDYSGRRHFALEPLDLNDLVREGVRLLEATLTRAGRVQLDLQPELPPIEGDAAQTRQVLSNLLTNAADALEGRRGTISVRTHSMRGDDPELHGAYLGGELMAADYACLEVSDTGAGMDEATRARMFDPFFTTKFPGRGLGLAAVLGIVRSHRGALQVHSAVDDGSTFRVLFRFAPPPDAAGPRAP